MNLRSAAILLMGAGLTLWTAGCAPLPSAATPGPDNASPTPPKLQPTQTAAASSTSLTGQRMGLTYQRPDGNRLVGGVGQLPVVEPVDASLDGNPLWLVAAPVDKGAVWAVVMDDGSVQAFHTMGRAVTPATIEPAQLPPGMPPVLVVKDGQPSLIPPPGDASPLTHPVMLSKGGQVYVADNGDVVVQQADAAVRLPVNALPDARLLVDEEDRVLLLSDGTDSRYVHGVLGDRLEAASITLLATRPQARVITRIELPDAQVVEGIAPIWADLTGDGVREILVTVSDASQGAQLVAFNEAGERVRSGPAIGQRSRWRHQLAVAPFAPDGAWEVVDVLTPHIGGVVEFYRTAESTLDIVARAPGYSSHVLGLRNLDMGVAGDFDGDGQVELLVPSQDRQQLGGIRHTEAGAEAVWHVPLGGELATNLAAVTLPDGCLAVGAGRADGVLRLWLPQCP